MSVENGQIGPKEDGNAMKAKVTGGPARVSNQRSMLFSMDYHPKTDRSKEI